MGLPITAEVVQSGRQEAYPLYVWLIDHPEGPVWQEMDESFERWNDQTGPYLAFFVDPFQRKEWAMGFLARALDREAVANLLACRGLVQRYFRERLAERACREMWIPQDRLPIAVIASRWNAGRAVLCSIPTREAVRRLLVHLTDFGRQHPPLERWPRLHSADEESLRRGENERLAAIESLCGRLELEHRIFKITTGEFSRIGREAIDTHALGPLVQWLERAGVRGGSGAHLSGSATRVSLASLDDMILLAHDLVGRADGLVSRFPYNADVRAIARALPLFVSLMTDMHTLREKLRVLAHDDSCNEQERMYRGAECLGELSRLVAAVEVDARLEALIGHETYWRLLENSRAALRSSEAIHALSDAVHELQEDLSAVLLGFWKASEIEGRRLLLDLLDRSGGIPVWNDREGRIEVIRDSRRIEREYTAGTLSWVLRNARFPHDSPWCGLPLPQLGERFAQMVRVARNRFIHREMLRDISEATRSRNLVACPPDGILPTTIQCIDTVGAEDDWSCPLRPEQEAAVAAMVSAVAPGNASAAVPRDLARLRGAMRKRYATLVVEKLKPRWLYDGRRANQAWIGDLFTALAPMNPSEAPVVPATPGQRREADDCLGSE